MSISRIYLIVTVDCDRHSFLNEFIPYYRNLGVTDFLITSHTDIALSQAERVRILHGFDEILSNHTLKSAGNLNCCFLSGERSGELAEFQAAIVKQYTSEGDWVIWADIDEFQQYWDDLTEIVNLSEKKGVNFVQGFFLDRISSNGDLITINEKDTLFEQFPLGCNITERILTGSIFKVTIAKASVKVSTGHHAVRYNESLIWADKNSIVHHFKWDSSVLKRLLPRVSEEIKAVNPFWYETQQFYDHINLHGKIDTSNLSLYNPKDFALSTFNKKSPLLPQSYFFLR